MRIRIRNGLDIPVDGVPDQVIGSAPEVNSVALVGADYIGLEPRMLVEQGDRVRVGQPLFLHKRDPEVVFTAPASGRVAAVHRGARRVLKSVVIDADDGPADEDVVSPSGNLREALLQTGLWTAFRTRPFSRIPASGSSPRSIFVTAMDTRPLAGDPSLIVSGFEEAFARGLEALTELCPEGCVYLCTAPDWLGPTGEHARIRHVQFEGPHPAGLPGTHIHHLDPVGADRMVWHIGYQDVIAVGRLVGERRLWLERIVALAGDGFRSPGLVRTRLGANFDELAADELRPNAGDQPPGLISGCPLGGREASGSEAFLGRYDLQVTALNPPDVHRRLRWRRLFDGRFSFAGTFTRASGYRKIRSFTTDQNGRATALVPVDALEKLIPLDVLAEPLLRSLLIQDTDQAQALGCLELDEEDLALCSFVCPGKNDYASVLRVNLNQIEREG